MRLFNAIFFSIFFSFHGWTVSMELYHWLQIDFTWFCNIFCNFYDVVTDVWMDGWTDRQNNGKADQWTGGDGTGHRIVPTLAVIHRILNHTSCVSAENSSKNKGPQRKSLPLAFFGWFQVEWLGGLVKEKHLRHVELKLWFPMLTCVPNFIKIRSKLVVLSVEVRWTVG